MTIRLTDGKPASAYAIEKLEKNIGTVLSDSFKGFLRIHNGAKPESNTVKISNNNAVNVNRFIPVEEIMKERAYIENIPPKAYPIAWATGGNYIFIDEQKDGAVFFWDHEEPEKIAKLASDFSAFLEVLEPFNVNSIELKPGQVKKVWIDPEFLKRVKK